MREGCGSVVAITRTRRNKSREVGKRAWIELAVVIAVAVCVEMFCCVCSHL